MSGTQFDTALKNTLTDTVLEEYADVIADAENAPVSFSRKYLRQKAEMLRNPTGYLKKTKRPVYVKVVRILAAALIILMLLAAGAALIPAKRNFDFEWYDQYVDVTVTNDVYSTQELKQGDCYPTYLPEGYAEYLIQGGKESLHYTFAKGDLRIGYDVYVVYQGLILGLDDEHWTFRETTFNGKAAYLMTGNESGDANGFLWLSNDGTVLYMLCGHVEVPELMKIAQSIN